MAAALLAATARAERCHAHRRWLPDGTPGPALRRCPVNTATTLAYAARGSRLRHRAVRAGRADMGATGTCRLAFALRPAAPSPTWSKPRDRSRGSTRHTSLRPARI